MEEFILFVIEKCRELIVEHGVTIISFIYIIILYKYIEKIVKKKYDKNFAKEKSCFESFLDYLSYFNYYYPRYTKFSRIYIIGLFVLLIIYFYKLIYDIISGENIHVNFHYFLFALAPTTLYLLSIAISIIVDLPMVKRFLEIYNKYHIDGFWLSLPFVYFVASGADEFKILHPSQNYQKIISDIFSVDWPFVVRFIICSICSLAFFYFISGEENQIENTLDIPHAKSNDNETDIDDTYLGDIKSNERL